MGTMRQRQRAVQVYRGQVPSPGRPTMFTFLLQHPKIDHYDLSSIRSIAYGAAAMPVAVLKETLDRFGPVVFPGVPRCLPMAWYIVGTSAELRPESSRTPRLDGRFGKRIATRLRPAAGEPLCPP